jgi:predicted CXXCH cytochrome family protein
MAKACLGAVLIIILAGTLIFVLAPGQELWAQNEPRTAASHDKTNFPLVGKHRSVACGDCHLNGVLAGTPMDCEACHWVRRQDDQYKLNFGIHCADCHTPFDWKKLKANSWEHGQATGFQLDGVHKTMDCTSCHQGNVFKGQIRECYSCHREEYERAPNHVKANYSTDCRGCHFSMMTWTGGRTDHSSFLLRGRHTAAACADCHINNVYAGTPRECVGCHLADYNATRDPNHKLAGFSTDCVSCHGSSAQTWNNAAVSHDQYWLLQGAHKNLDCSKCHSAGYDLPRDCYGCHRGDYEKTTNPNHRQSGYSTFCDNCHFASHTSWHQAVFTHKFPIKSGKHAGFACTDCHLTGNYLVFSCIDCHTHSKSTVDSKHKDVRGYSYNSQACYSCHPQGSGGD